MHHKATAVLVAALALGVASCGGSSSRNTSTSAQPVSFSARVDAACAQTTKSMATVIRSVRQTRATADLAAAKSRAIGILRDEVRSLEAITPPANLQADYELYKASVRNRLDSATGASGSQRATSSRQLIQQQDKKHRAVRRLGLKQCF